MGRKRGCGNCCLSIKTRYTLSYLRAHRIGPDRLYDPGRFFPRSGRFTPIAPLKFFIQNRRCTSGFFLGDSSPLVRFTSACQLGTPAPPSGPLPRCGWEPPAVRGRRGPSLPAVPSLPHLRKTRFCTPCFASCKGATPYKTSCFAQVRGPALGWVGRSLSLPVDSRGGYPPAPPPDLSRGAPGASLSVGARLRPVSALPRPPRSAGFAAPRPGRLRPSLAPPQRRPYRVRLRPCTLRAVSASAIA